MKNPDLDPARGVVGAILLSALLYLVIWMVFTLLASGPPLPDDEGRRPVEIRSGEILVQWGTSERLLALVMTDGVQASLDPGAVFVSEETGRPSGFPTGART